MVRKRNVYSHEIELEKLRVKNAEREKFREELEGIPYRGYEVEKLKDGRKVVITKPGGKFTYGKIRREDLMVWILDEEEDSLWLISHKDIFEDLKGKAEKDPAQTRAIIEALERVHGGEDPDDVLGHTELPNPVGEEPELLLKAYKWIWGQEDCNYPDGEGRNMSYKGLLELKKKL